MLGVFLLFGRFANRIQHVSCALTLGVEEVMNEGNHEEHEPNESLVVVVDNLLQSRWVHRNEQNAKDCPDVATAPIGIVPFVVLFWLVHFLLSPQRIVVYVSNNESNCSVVAHCIIELNSSWFNAHYIFTDLHFEGQVGSDSMKTGYLNAP